MHSTEGADLLNSPMQVAPQAFLHQLAPVFQNAWIRAVQTFATFYITRFFQEVANQAGRLAKQRNSPSHAFKRHEVLQDHVLILASIFVTGDSVVRINPVTWMVLCVVPTAGGATLIALVDNSGRYVLNSHF
jgi:hypothetical protein